MKFKSLHGYIVFTVLIAAAVFVSMETFIPDKSIHAREKDDPALSRDVSVNKKEAAQDPAPLAAKKPEISAFFHSRNKVSLNNEQELNIFKMLRAADVKSWPEARAYLKRVKGEKAREFARNLYLWMAFTHGYTGKIKFEEVIDFLEDNPGWPERRKIRLYAENILNDKTPDSLVVLWFADNPPITPDGMKAYLSALDRTGEQDSAREILREWWYSAVITPDQQREFFKNYSDWFSLEDHERRLQNLISLRQYTNARILARGIGKSYRYLVEAKIRLSARQPGVDRLIELVPAHLKDDPGLMYERLKWRRKENLNDRAIEVLLNPPPVENIANPEEWWHERHIIIRRLIEEKDFEKAYYIAGKHIQKEGFALAQAEWVAGWLALRFVNKPWQAFEHFEKLYNSVSTPISRARGAYWAGRASEVLGHPDVATEWYLAAALHGGTFYGQLASAALRSMPKDELLKQDIAFDGDKLIPQKGVTFSLNVEPPKINFREKEAFLKHELVVASKLFVKAGVRSEAGDFLKVLGKMAKTPSDFRMAAELATSLKQPHDALHVAKLASYQGVILTDQAYPTVIQYLENIDEIEWALVHGIIRQESAFNPTATSSAGAQGLMQLLPTTANYIARKTRLSYQRRWLHDRPDYNIKLGASYMAYLLDKYNGSVILALAAYNGGPGRVASWLETYGNPREGQVEWIDWIELIPVYETRNYVQRVLESVHVYRLILEDVDPNRNGQPLQVTMGVHGSL